MGFLKRFIQSRRRRFNNFPPGSMTVDRDGKVVTTTIRSGYPPALLREIAREVLTPVPRGA